MIISTATERAHLDDYFCRLNQVIICLQKFLSVKASLI